MISRPEGTKGDNTREEEEATVWKGREKDAEEQKGGDFFRHPPSAFHRGRKGRKVEEGGDLTHFVSFLSGLGKGEKERKFGETGPRVHHLRRGIERGETE